MAFTKAHPRDAARTKIDRAQEHVQNLNTLIGEYIAGDPYKFSVRTDPDGTQRAFLDDAVPIPVRLSAIIGDILHNARSALDALATYGGYLETGTAKELKFPIFKDRSAFNEKAFNNFKNCPKTIRFIRRLKPYERGCDTFSHSDALVLLNRLSNRDKHTSIIPIAAVLAKVVVSPLSGPGGEFEVNVEGKVPVSEREEIFVWKPDDPRFAGKLVNTQITLKIVLHGVETKTPINATSLLMHIVGVVDRIVSMAERRLYP